ncbi:sporulation protein [Embleya scabrispora]|uniref:sporulation protein n=1 Tax=Embleya scabrispora TaxID=159449 RepID=UPI000381C362|nr:sporulation protein [Embleya scabrispora]MYS86476.1 sporulation protein [Streptomyces sp. SID5474]
MVFKKLMASMGAGSASVETELHSAETMPGGVVEGRIRVRGGKVDQRIEGLFVGFQAVVEVETQDGEQRRNVEFGRHQVGGEFGLREGATHDLQFRLPVPWETPLTMFRGVQLRGTTIGVRTELAIDRAIDKGDLDPISVGAFPAQALILDAFGNLGFHFKAADLEQGHIRGVDQRLPFYQEIEFAPPQAYARGINEVELTFVSAEHATEVILEIDKKGGALSGGSDAIRRFTVDHGTAQQTDWNAYLHGWFQELGQRRGWF